MNSTAPHHGSRRHPAPRVRDRRRARWRRAVLSPPCSAMLSIGVLFAGGSRSRRATNNVLTVRSILKFTAAGDPDRKRFAKASLARLGYISLVAGVFLLVFRREGIAVLAGLALFHLLAALATTVPVLKEFRRA